MDKQIIKGRGALSNQTSRFEKLSREAFDDGWPGEAGQCAVGAKTEVYVELSRTIISRNDSPDVPFSLSINPYKGCEHGCVYCFARPTHAYLDLSPGLDFETKLFFKPNAAALLTQELKKLPNRGETIALGANTDAYQPIERKLQVTRKLLEELLRFKQSTAIITKSALIERDIDLLSELASDDLLKVVISVTSLDPKLSALMEPRAAAPHRRLKTISRLSEAGIPVGVLLAPVIPALNDSELEDILAACAAAGASSASFILLRLPHELKSLFREWLQQHFPHKAKRVMNLLREMRGGRDYSPQFGTRMSGEGVYAKLLADRFALAWKYASKSRRR